MGDETYDYAIVGGGLQGGLLALALGARRPAPRVLIVEKAARLGGNHTWCFHDDDLTPAMRALVAPLVVARWDGYRVRFPGRERRLAVPYRAVTSERFDACVRRSFVAAGGTLLLERSAIAIAADHVRLDGGDVIAARAVIDARGPLLKPPDGTCGYQKFLGLELVLDRPHGLAEPLLMDATVEQRDGFRFVYCLPLAPDRLLVEDTYFSDHPSLDLAMLRTRVLQYTEAWGLRIDRVEREETGVLPMPWRGQLLPRASAPLKVGVRGGFSHPATGYSFTVAARLAETLAGLTSETQVGSALQDLAVQLERQARFARLLNRLLFGWYAPDDRWHVLERFYRLPDETLRRFYALDMTPGDYVRILGGRPPTGFSLRRGFQNGGCYAGQ